jgi:hypothetical protein
MFNLKEKTMKTKNLKLLAIFLLLLPLCVVLLGAGCEKESSFGQKDISGSWKVSKQSISGNLTYFIAPPDNALYTDISIVFPDTTKGIISGNTFFNSIGVDFEIKEDQHISFKNYGGTRIAEDNWGMSFGENLRNTVKFDISNNELLFIDSQNQPIIIFVKTKNR